MPHKCETAPTTPHLHKDFLSEHRNNAHNTEPHAGKKTSPSACRHAHMQIGTQSEWCKNKSRHSRARTLPRCLPCLNLRMKMHAFRLCSLSCHKYWTVFSFKFWWIIYSTPCMEEEYMFFSFPWTAEAWVCVCVCVPLQDSGSFSFFLCAHVGTLHCWERVLFNNPANCYAGTESYPVLSPRFTCAAVV